MAEVSILTDPEGPVPPWKCSRNLAGSDGFNPHRPRRAGATRGRFDAVAVRLGDLFQSSPTPKGRCHLFLLSQPPKKEKVSILTDPEGPVPPRDRSDRASLRVRVSILTDPEGPVPRHATSKQRLSA